MKLFLLLALVSATKTKIYTMSIPKCSYTNINSIPEICTYNYNDICSTPLVITNMGCSTNNGDKYVIIN